MFSHFFIDRPIFAAVISIIISIGGLVAMMALPIAQFPDITPPQVTVSANYPGADASTVAVGYSLIAASGVGIALAMFLFIREQLSSTVIRRKLDGGSRFSKRVPE